MSYRIQNAHLAEILRAHQKDDVYLLYSNNSLYELIQALVGARWCFAYNKEIALLSHLAYYILTTLSDLQTIGEEYVNIVQVEGGKTSIPSRPTRLASVLLQCTTPYCIARVNTWLSNHTQDTLTQDVVGLTTDLADIIHRVHLAVFYLHGAFYRLSMRLTHTRYVKVRRSQSDGVSLSPLGYLSLTHCFLSLFLTLEKFRKKYDAHRFNEPKTTVQRLSTETYVSPCDRCPLCWERRVDPALTPCGHLFCWKCIHEWATNKNECPKCRDTFSPSRLVVLQNFDSILL